MINIIQFRDSIVKSTLTDLLLNSDNAEELLVFTCAVESLGGTYIRQVNGPALGIYQMEPITYNDIWQNYIKNRSGLSMKLMTNFHLTMMPSEERLIWDLRFSTAMARIHYARFEAPLPNCKDVDAIWNYYKKYYNTSLGKAKKDESIKKYNDFIKF